MFDPEEALYENLEENNIFLERDRDIKMWYDDDLPHWEQNGKTQFITFRLKDSLPQTMIRHMTDIKCTFLKTHPEPWTDDVRLEFYKAFNPFFHKYLDAGYGSCIMRDPEIRSKVERGINLYTGNRYDMLGYVIMPNHVHLVATMFDGYSSYETFEYVKKYSSYHINRILQSRKKLFSKCWDRLIRNEAHLNYVLAYIMGNPKHLSSSEYTLGGRLIERYLKHRSPQ